MKSAIFCAAVCLSLATSAFADSTGKVLILDTEQLLEGEIRLVGGRYHIRRGTGETVIPATRVLELLPDRPAAYRAMFERCNRRDFDDRLRLARWCLENGFRAEALAEAEALLRYKPDHAGVQQFVAGMHALKSSLPVPALAQNSDKVIEIEPLNYNPDAFAPFVAKIQPILMNACARCHIGTGGGNFTLEKVIEGGSRKASLQNLSATLKQLNRRDLGNSPLLLKAVTAHGDAKVAPLRETQLAAVQNLQVWALIAVPLEEPVQLPPAVVTPAAIVSEKLTVKATGPQFGETSSSRARPEAQTEAKDPFDPAIFNGTIQKK